MAAKSASLDCWRRPQIALQAEATIRLTHEVISTMLGVRRPSATLFAQNLKNAGVIGYSHGKVEILDRSKLEFEACECLDYMRRQRQELGFHTRESDVLG